MVLGDKEHGHDNRRRHARDFIKIAEAGLAVPSFLRCEVPGDARPEPGPGLDAGLEQQRNGQWR